ncbi:MAG: ABC transporter substrate-binding protein [Actinomycetota bacterium]|nr:ABC transporter substrate-binding protein [Actinomycetota bacterium]
MGTATSQGVHARVGLTRRDALKLMGLTGAAASFPAVLSGCGSPEDGGGGETGDIESLTWIITSLVHLDMAKAGDPGSKAAQSLVNDSLLTLDADLQMVGSLAESWEEIDPQTYVYKLRSGVKFSDGSPMTADDVVFSYLRHQDPELGSTYSPAFVDVVSCEATADDEVTVKLSRPAAFWQYVPSYAPIVSRAFVEGLGSDFGTPGSDTTLGTGPYIVTNFAGDEKVELTRNEDYWGTKPAVKNVSLELITNSQTAQLAMRSGDADGMFFISVTEAGDWEEIEGLNVTSAPGLAPAYCAWDMNEEPWSDIHVRKAISFALDRVGLVDGLLAGYAQPANSLVPKDQWQGMGLPEGRVDEIYASLTQYDFDLDKAREELALSAFPDGFAATVKYGDAKPELGQAALNLKETLAEIGIDLTVEEVPLQQEIADVVGHTNIGFRILSFTPELLDPADYPSYMLSTEYARPNSFNISNYSNLRVDELLQQQGVITDVEERAAMLEEVMQIISDELPYLPVWWEDIAMPLREEYEFEGLHPLFFKKGIWVASVTRAA